MNQSSKQHERVRCPKGITMFLSLLSNPRILTHPIPAISSSSGRFLASCDLASLSAVESRSLFVFASCFWRSFTGLTHSCVVIHSDIKAKVLRLSFFGPSALYLCGFAHRLVSDLVSRPKSCGLRSQTAMQSFTVYFVFVFLHALIALCPSSCNSRSE